MAFWFYRGLRKGIATTRYPKTIDPWTRDLPTPPAFHSRRLTALVADALADACPSGAITREGPELILDLGRCTCCRRCLEIAGDAAAPGGAFLLATEERSALVKRVPIRGDREARP
jgi:hypothetical protein